MESTEEVIADKPATNIWKIIGISMIVLVLALIALIGFITYSYYKKKCDNPVNPTSQSTQYKNLKIKMDFTTFLINDNLEYSYSEKNEVKIAEILENNNNPNYELKLNIDLHKNDIHPIKVTDKDNNILTDLSNISTDILPLTFQCKNHGNMRFELHI